MASGLAALAPLAGILKGIGGATDIQNQQSEMERRRQLMALAQLQEQRESQQFQQQQNAGNFAGNALGAIPDMRQQILSGLQQQPQPSPMQPTGMPQQAGGGDQLMPRLAGSGVNWQNESPELRQRVSSMLAGAPPDVRDAASVDSGFRSNEQQAAAYQRFKSGQGGLAAPPGQSKHEVGQAADWSFKTPAADQWFHQNASKFGLGFPLGSRDPNHMQLAAANQAIGQTAVGQAQAGAPIPLVKGAAGVSRQALGEIDPAQYGQATSDAIIKAVEKAGPNASGMEKLMAVQQLQKLMLPEERMQMQAYMQQNRDNIRLALAATTGAETQRHHLATEDQAAENLATKQAQFKEKAAGGMETVDSVAKGIAEYRQAPLSSWVLARPWGQAVMKQVYEINPNYSAPQYAAGVSGARAFGTGKQADQTRSMSVAIDHLAVADDLADALQNSDSRLLNAAKNGLLKQFGYEGPVDFDTAKMIVSDEVTKAIAGGTLSMTERTALQDQISKAGSPEQLKGVSGTLKRLLGGQLAGLRRQYENLPGAGKPDFDTKVSPRARQELKGGGSVASDGKLPGAPEGAHLDITEEQYNGLPSKSIYTVPGDPTPRVKP